MIKIIAIVVAMLCLIPSNVLGIGKLVVYGSLSETQMNHSRVKSAISAFEKKYQVKIVFTRKTPLSTDELHKAYKNILAAGNDKPDILEIDVVRIPEFASMGYLLELTPYTSKNELKQFFPSAVDEVMWKNKVWAYPHYLNFGLILYRKDLIDHPPQTWYELIEKASELQRDDLYGYVGQMANYEGLMCNALEFIWSNGGNPNFESSDKIFSANDIDALQLMVDIVRKYKLTPEDQLNYKEYEGMQLIKNGSILFLRHWPQALFELKKYGDISEARYAAMPIPKGPSGSQGYSTLGGWTLAVNKNSKNLKAAVALLKLLTSNLFQRHLALEMKGFPVKMFLYRDREVVSEYPWFASIYPSLVSARSRPRSAYYPEISRIVQQEFHLALEGKITAKKAIERAEKNIQAFKRSVN